ncbi:MAG: SDR family oxidoreductase [Bacteroidota bacterium]|nr:SDR family oxidoreductase [Bacteroidota bacterium]MDP4234035.1 SDR family oxidoreductase [Bacteroidota bacterium]MDP4242901.1 SDR family oxidoreductase [Bacteroidota bacterium]MDP4287660.1 SDR family oxidoreductase [Bacteroidota bacterium]
MEGLALVTGAGRGIGRAIAFALAEANIPVVLVARSNEEITDIRNEIISNGGSAWACPCDITKVDEVNGLVTDIAAEVGAVNILVNNAGVAPSAKLEDTTDEMWRETFGVNVDGPFYLMRALLPQMKVSGGQVISIASTAALQGFRYTAAYTASKHALLGLMRALTEEMKNTPIVFSTICPGFTRTNILEESILATMARGKSREEAEAIFAAMNREGHIIETEEIAQTVMNLISSSNATSGQAYHADGTPISGV